MKKGFTLVELLAVILILGVIALIALPSISGIMDEARKSSFKVSSNNILKAVKQQCQYEKMKGKEITKYYRFEDSKSLASIDMKGENPKEGNIVVDDNCHVDLVLNKDNYIAYKSFDDNKVEIIEGTYYKPGTNISYNPGDTNYSNWYVLKDHGEDVTLILGKNLNIVAHWIDMADYKAAGGIESNFLNDEIKYGPLTAIKTLKSLTSAWSSDAKAHIRLLKISDIEEVLGLNGYNYDNDLYFDTKSSTPPVINGISNNVWLFNSLADCMEFGCSYEGDTAGDYWLSDAKFGSKNIIYWVTRSGKVSQTTNDAIINGGYYLSGSGIRPVITIKKSLLSNEMK